jgi:flagellar hook-associated protein 2
MATMTASGWGSTLDVNNIVSQLMAVEQQPVKKLDLKEAGYQARISAYGTLRGGLAALQEAARNLNGKVVASDTASIKPELESFVKAYNEVAKPLRDLSSYDVRSRKAAVLQGDTAVRAIQIQLRNSIAASVSGGTGALKTLSQIGVAFQKDGSLAIDSTKLQSAIDSNAVAVSSIVNAIGGELKTLLNSQLSSDGALATKADAANLNVRLLNVERTKLNARLADTEQRYRRQYAALDSLLGSMKSANDALTQQLAGLSHTNSG